MCIRNIKMTIAYDGSDFAGYQRQGKLRTVQGELEKALETLHKAHITLSAAGRTDAGVHATGQVVNFWTNIRSMEAGRFIPALNSLLKRDIRVLEAVEAAESFHARFSARARHYRYHIVAGRCALPHETRYALQLWRHPDIALLNSYARCLHGETDCTLFASPADPALSSGTACRYIHKACFYYSGTALIFEISANAFLWKMVRSIVGSFLFFEEKGLGTDAFKALLHSGSRPDAGPAAPPQGLFLSRVDY